ncbi:hypothetical protein FXO38_31238 [Capsicum annuum]|nr:hypothetical protein FXO37_34809 [Capsicum annuum]KAF3622519.1 hypothetical protein FXO38_31238 [Capsicum annuum]
MVDNTPTKMVTRSIPCSDPDVHTVSTFDLGISQIEEEDALRSEEVRGIGYKRKVTDDVPSLDNDDDELVKEGEGNDDNDVVNIAILYFINTFIFSGEKHSISIPKIHFYLIENDAVKDTTSDDVSSDDDFQDAPPATEKNKPKKKIDNASSPPHKKQKQVKSLSPVAKHQTKKVVTQKTVPRRTLPKQPPILQKRKFIVKPPVKPKPSNVPTNVRSSSKSDEESILAKQFVIFQESGPNVEAAADIPTVPQSSPQDINVAHFSVPNQPDTSTGHNVEDVEDIPVISQPSSQHIGTGHSSTPKQSDTCSVELQQCHPKYRNRDESDPFEMIFVNDIPQQRSGSMDYGIYVDAYAEFLTGGQGVPNQEFDIALLRTR